MRKFNVPFLIISFLSFKSFAEDKIENKVNAKEQSKVILPSILETRKGISLGLVLGNNYWTNPVTQKITKLPVMIRSYQSRAKDILGYFIHLETDSSTLIKVQQLKLKKTLDDFVANLTAQMKKEEMCISFTKPEPKEINKIKTLRFTCQKSNGEDFLTYVWAIDKNRFLSVYSSFDHLSPKSLEYAESFATSFVQ